MLLGLVLMQVTGWAWLDPVIAIFVAGIIFRAGWRMIVESAAELTDASLAPEEEEAIGAIFDHVPEVRGWHCLRTRKSGSYKLLDVHILFDGNMHLLRVHAVCDEIEQAIRAQFGTFDVLIHAEPVDGHTQDTKTSVYEEAHDTRPLVDPYK